MEEIFDKLEPIFLRKDKNILKTTNTYISRDRKSILNESLAIEGSKKIQFLAMISGRDDGVVVRIYPGYEVEKTDGVKKILVEISSQLIDKIPQLKVGETNLSEYFHND